MLVSHAYRLTGEWQSFGPEPIKNPIHRNTFSIHADDESI